MKTTVIELESVKWSPYHTERGYACGRLSTIVFDKKDECDSWVEENNKLTENVPGWGKYVTLPYITGADLMKATVLEKTIKSMPR